MKRTTNKNKSILRQIRHSRVRSRVIGTAEIPRLSVFRSLKGVILQLIDDRSGKTLCYVDSKNIKSVKIEGKSAKVAAAYLAGKQLAEDAKSKKVFAVVFDRGGYKYHGRVAAAAEGAREGGLKF